MLYSRKIVSTLFIFVLLDVLNWEKFQAQAQAPRLSSTSIPAAGEAIEIGNSNETTFPGNPLPGGMSNSTLGDLIKGMRQNTAMRGAREVAIFRQAAPAVVLLRTKEGSGSGVVLQNGLVLTNRHVVEGIGVVQIFFKPDDLTQDRQATQVRSGTVRFVDAQRDLAVIVPESLPPNFKFLKIAARDDIDVGTDVYAIGHPLGYTWTFTQGIISGVRTITTEGQHYTAIQTQTPINPGNSGGPLLNNEMEVMGINTWVRDISTVEKKEFSGENVTIARPAQGLNFAVSARDVRSFLADMANGKFANLALQMPNAPSGCSVQTVFNGRAKTNDAGLLTFSTKCDNKVDAWEIFPDDKLKPVEFHLDPDRSGKSSIVVFSDIRTGKWGTSLWDFFRDQTFAVVGLHDDGRIQPTRFEFARN